MGNFFWKMTGVFCFHYLSSFFFRKIKMKNGHHILLVLKEAMSLTFERSINLLENVTSNNICHSCWTQRCPLFRGVRYSKVFILGFALIPAVPRKCVRYSHLRYCGLLLYTPLKFPSNCRLLLLKPFTSVWSVPICIFIQINTWYTIFNCDVK